MHSWKAIFLSVLFFSLCASGNTSVYPLRWEINSKHWQRQKTTINYYKKFRKLDGTNQPKICNCKLKCQRSGRLGTLHFTIYEVPTQNGQNGGWSANKLIYCAFCLLVSADLSFWINCKLNSVLDWTGDGNWKNTTPTRLSKAKQGKIKTTELTDRVEVELRVTDRQSVNHQTCDVNNMVGQKFMLFLNLFSDLGIIVDLLLKNIFALLLTKTSQLW